MRPKKPKTTRESDLFRAKLDQIINLKYELVQLGAKIDWDWIDREIAPLYSDKGGLGRGSRAVSSSGSCYSSTSTACPTRACASAGSTIRTSSTSRALSLSSTSFRTSEAT